MTKEADRIPNENGYYEEGCACCGTDDADHECMQCGTVACDLHITKHQNNDDYIICKHCDNHNLITGKYNSTFYG